MYTLIILTLSVYRLVSSIVCAYYVYIMHLDTIRNTVAHYAPIDELVHSDRIV